MKTQKQRLGPDGTRPPWLRFISLRSVQLVLAFWVLATVAVLFIARDDELPFDRPAVAGSSLAFEVASGWISLSTVLLLGGITYLVTRKRVVPNMASRAPARAVALAETALLVGYAIVVQLGGLVLGRVIGDHAISLHMAGTLYGTSHPISPVEAVVWMLYNFAFFAVLPYLFFRRRGYTNEQLNLRSSNKRNDALLILVVLGVESALEVSAFGGALFALDANQALAGALLSFLLNFFGTVLPIMVFVYCILLPCFYKLSGSFAATVVLGGITYAIVHAFEAWAVYDSFTNAALSVIFLAFQYVPPGMVKSILTLKTGNAWVHVWAYHAIAPHTHIDAPNTTSIFGLK